MTTGNPLMDILNGSIADLGAVPVIPDKKIGKLIKKIVKKDKPTPDIDDDYILMPKGEKEEE